MQIAEYKEWDFYPQYLSPKEMNEPLSVLAVFFHDDDLPGHLERSKEWRDTILKVITSGE